MTDYEKNMRCKGCKYERKINAQNDWWFKACYCEPYNGKHIAEIEKCPKETVIIGEVKNNE